MNDAARRRSLDALRVLGCGDNTAGIYLDGDGGVRIEDVVIVSETGCENIAPAPKTLVPIAA